MIAPLLLAEEPFSNHVKLFVGNYVWLSFRSGDGVLLNNVSWKQLSKRLKWEAEYYDR